MTTINDLRTPLLSATSPEPQQPASPAAGVAQAALAAPLQAPPSPKRAFDIVPIEKASRALSRCHKVKKFAVRAFIQLCQFVKTLVWKVALIPLSITSTMNKWKTKAIREQMRKDISVNSLKALSDFYSQGNTIHKPNANPLEVKGSELFHAARSQDDLSEDLKKKLIDLELVCSMPRALINAQSDPYQVMKKFYILYNKIGFSDEYKKLDKDTPIVQLMMHLSITMVEKVEGLSVYEKFGKDILGDFKTPRSFGDLRILFMKAQDTPHFDSYRRDATPTHSIEKPNAAQKLVQKAQKPVEKFANMFNWALEFDAAAEASKRGEREGVHYQDSTRHGNMVTKGWEYDRKVLSLFQGGTFDPILFEYARANSEGLTGPLLHHNFQNDSKHGEKARREFHQQLANHSENLEYSSTFMDGEVFKMKGTDLMKAQDENDFFDKFIDLALQDNNYHISEKALVPKDQDAALAKVKEAFNLMNQWNADLSDKEKVRLGQARQLGFQGFILLGELLTLSQNSNISENIKAKIRTVCKQMIDRGAVGAVMMRLLYLLNRGQLLKTVQTTPEQEEEIRKEICQLAGVLFGRPFLTEGRMPFYERVEPFFDFLQAFDGKEEGLKGILQAYEKVIKTPAAEPVPQPLFAL